MQWTTQNTEFSRTDLKETFDFHENYQSFEIQAVKIRKLQNAALDIEEKSLCSEEEYKHWTNQCHELISETRCPLLVLVMHRRLKEDWGEPKGATDLPYGKSVFQHACKNLFQHRSVAHTLPRKSTAIFNTRPVHWGAGSLGHSVVYNCISDTESLHGNNNIVLSTTSFAAVPVTVGVFYGCTTDMSKIIARWLKRCGESCFHPMILPMIFVELERKRLLDCGECKGSKLLDRVSNLEVNFKTQEEKYRKKGELRLAGPAEDVETIKMLLSMNQLKNGLEGLLTQLSSMRDHLGKPSEILLAGIPAGDSVGDVYGLNIDLRLKEIMAELQSKLRTYEGLLESITLATQMEATNFTRADSWVNITIARASKRDSTHMRFISLMGMVFLPGTFLATLFSMTFFNWTPSTNDQVVSPWVALYFGLTVITTAFTILYWNRRSTQEWDSKEQFMDDLEGARKWMDEARRSESVVHVQGVDVIESGAEVK